QACVPAVLQIGAQPVAGAGTRRHRAASISRSGRVPRVFSAGGPRVGGRMSVRIGVVGAGALGYHHTRILRDVPGAQLVGFHDSNRDRADHVSRELGVRAYPALETLLDAVDAVSIAVPTPAHHIVAVPALDRGLH